MSQVFLAGDLWRTLKKQAAKAGRKEAAIAYVSSDKDIKFSRNDTLVTDASEYAIKAAQTSALVLSNAFRRGAQIFSCPGLHAKTIVFDQRLAFVGSANMSENSQKMVEAGVLTDDPLLVGGCRAFIEDLCSRCRPMSKADIERLRKIKVIRAGGRFAPRTRFKPKAIGRSAWLVSVSPIRKKINISDQAVIDSGEKISREKLERPNADIDWIRWRRSGNKMKSNFHKFARPGDQVFIISNSRQRGVAVDVYPATTILHRDEGKNATFFFYQATRAYESQYRSWSKFCEVARRAGLRKPGKSSNRKLTADEFESLYRLWRKR